MRLSKGTELGSVEALTGFASRCIKSLVMG